jgi:hypothetical protein
VEFLVSQGFFCVGFREECRLTLGEDFAIIGELVKTYYEIKRVSLTSSEKSEDFEP